MKPFIAIFLINVLTSIDNVIVVGGIASRYRYLVPISLASTVVITVCRTLVIMGIGRITAWPGFRFMLGAAVFIVALQLANARADGNRENQSFWRVLLLVVVTDMALSVDNVLSISMISKNPIVVASSVFLSLLPLLLLLPIIVRTMDQVIWLRILAAGFVAELAIDSITDDPLIARIAPQGNVEVLLRVASAVVVIIYGFWMTYRRRVSRENR